MGAFVSYFFSGFILGKIPFPLSPSFRLMLQVLRRPPCLIHRWACAGELLSAGRPRQQDGPGCLSCCVGYHSPNKRGPWALLYMRARTFGTLVGL